MKNILQKYQKISRRAFGPAITCLVLVSFIFMGFLASACYAEKTVYKSSLVWRLDGQGDYLLPPFKSDATYIIQDTATTDGDITSMTANWTFTGEVTLALSADGGNNYTPVTNGVPLAEGFVSGNRIKWSATLGPESALTEVKIVYTDSSGVLSSFGEPQLQGFKYRKALKLTNPSDESLFNYQVNVKVAESAAGEDDDIGCDGASKADFLDVRFTAADAQTLLPYYLEKITGSQPGRQASFWVKVPEVPPGELTLFLYYSNETAEDLSDAEAVFDFYDGFKTRLLDQDKWEAELLDKTGSHILVGDTLKLSGAQILSKDYKMEKGIIEYRAKAGAGDEIRAIIRDTKEGFLSEASKQVAYSSAYEGAEHCLAIGDVVKANQAEVINSGETYDYRILINGTELTFQRYEQNGQEVQAEAVYNDQAGLTSGSIGFMSGIGRATDFEWVRVRKYASVDITVDRESSADAAGEGVEMPEFNDMVLAANGNLILSDENIEGSYVSPSIRLSYVPRIFMPSWEVLSLEDGKVAMDVSMDGGAHYALGCEKDVFCYTSQDDFTAGDNMKFKLALTEDKDNPEVDMISMEYSPGVMTLIYPNGGEKLQAGSRVQIRWTALEYDPSYHLKLEFSADNGASYSPIISATANTGSYSWSAPNNVTTKGRIRISDPSAAEAVYDVSDRAFSVAAEGDKGSREEAVVVPEKPSGSASALELGVYIDIAKYREYGQREGAALYDLLVKLRSRPTGTGDGEMASFKEGDILMAKPHGHEWSKTEKTSYLIIQIYLTEAEAAQITRPKLIKTGEVDKSGKPVMKAVKRRAKKIDLDKLGLSRSKNKETAIKEIQKNIEGKVLKKEIIEEK